MPQLPYSSRITASSVRSTTSLIPQSGGADAFGASVFQAAQQSSEQIMRSTQVAADILNDDLEKRNRENQVNSIASFDFSGDELNARNEVDADATGYKDLVKDKYIEKVDAHVEGIESNSVRNVVRQQLISQLPNVIDRSTKYELTVRAERSKDQANNALNTLNNKIIQDPSQYEASLQQGYDVIDARSNLPAAQKEGMKQQYLYDSTKRLFEGKLSRATRPEELMAVEQELKNEKWQDKLLPRDMEDFGNRITAGRKAYNTQIESEVKASLSGLESRAKDPTQLIPSSEIASAQQIVRQTGDMGAQRRIARVVRDQQIVTSERKLNPAQLRARIEDATMQEGVESSALPPDISGFVNSTANDYGVNASYLNSTILREYWGELSKAKPAYDVSNPESSATGIMQFTKKTFLDLAKDPSFAAALDIKPGTPDEAILELRKDPKKAIIAGAILAKRNGDYIQNQLGRPANDVELYMAHFLGAPEATRFLKLAQTNDQAPAASAFPDAAAANKNVFYADKGKTPLSVGQVYENISRQFADSVTSVAYDDNQTRTKMLDKMEAALSSSEGLKYAASVGVIDLVPLDQEGAYAARSKAWETAGTYYGRSLSPFTADEEAYMQKTIVEGSVDKTLGLMGEIQSMGPKAATAAFSQLKVKNPAFAHAGMLALDGDNAVASDIVRGYKRMKENPGLLTGLKFKEDKAAQDFESIIGPSLSRISPGERQAVQEAALAYFVETQAANGKEYKRTLYEDSVKKVLHGRIDKINSEKTYLPTGVTARELERTLGKMTLQDYISLSPKGATPLHFDGTPIDPRDMQDEVKLRAIGDNKYVLADGQGAFLWTGNMSEEGYPEKFVIDLKPERIRNILNRKATN